MEINLEHFEKAFFNIITIEGGYVNNPSDPGGETKYGICKRDAESYNYFGEIKDITIEEAKRIYKEFFWDRLYLDKIANIYPPLAEEIFESAINCGVLRVSDWFCNAVQSITYNFGSSYNESIAYVINYPQELPILTKIMNIYQGNHYLTLVKKNDKYKKFIRGWLKRVRL